MALNSFTPNTRIESGKVNQNFTNLSDHARWIGLLWTFRGTVTTNQTAKDYLSLPDNVTWERADLACDTAPTGAAIIVDIERSTDSGATWVTIFTNQSNRPQIAIGARTGSTTTVDVSAGTENSHLYRAVVEQVGSTVAGADLSVILKGKIDLD